MRLLSDIIFFIAYVVAGYRKDVVRQNLASAFPQKSKKELQHIERAYYHHLSDLLVEALHNLYASPRAIKRRYRFVNRQLIDPYFERGQTIILMSAHYNNWEYMVTSLNMQMLHHGIGVGKQLNDKLTANYITRRRTRYGTEVVDHRDVRQVVDFYHRHRVPCALMMLSDQSPSNPVKSVWIQFLNHDTAFLYGAEYFARKYNYPVFYYKVNKVRRGQYEVTFSPLCLEPQKCEPYGITKLYASMLEHDIIEQPEYWLWSHRRWKLKRNQ
ncbi:MAG: lysophospholipid acyltransferase family protein [Bacteroidales bacterium]|nr:lysophospholipid acyltransferase family protein [Bacteroidales bacterium]